MITSTAPSEDTIQREPQDARVSAELFEQLAVALELWLETVDGIDIARLDGETCLRIVGMLLGAQSMAYGRILKYIAAADKSDIATDEGHRALSSLLSARTRMTPSESNRALRDARVLENRPKTMDALCEGRISRAHAGAIVDAIKAGATTPGGAARAEETMLDLALHADAAVVRREVRDFRRSLKPKPPGDEHDRRERSAACRFAQSSDGTWNLTATLGPEGAAIVETTFNALMAEAGGSGGGGPLPDGGECPVPKPSTVTAQARADALVQACSLALGAVNSRGALESRPQMVVLVPAEGLRTGAGQPLRTSFGDMLPAPVLERLACDADIALAAVDDRGNPVAAGPFSRLYSKEQRLAVTLRDQGCVFPGCGLPSGWCEVHWSGSARPGGLVDLGDLALLCRSHHIDVHRSGWPRNSRFADAPTDG